MEIKCAEVEMNGTKYEVVQMDNDYWVRRGRIIDVIVSNIYPAVGLGAKKHREEIQDVIWGFKRHISNVKWQQAEEEKAQQEIWANKNKGKIQTL